MFVQPVMPVFVAWNTLQWMPVGLGSFRQHFPSWHVLVIDNNPTEGDDLWNEQHEAERRWIDTQPGVFVVRNSGSSRTHGAAMDLAVDWCRQHQIEYLLHLEPDCLISGTQWYYNLCLGIDAGAWMVGSHRKQYGPIHPTPSLWQVAQIRTTFDYTSRLADEQHPRFAELFDRDWLIQAVTDADQDTDFWSTTWDTAQRPWFECAKEGKAMLAEESADFVHFWQGTDSYFTGQTFATYPELRTYSEGTSSALRLSPENISVSPFSVSLGNMLVQKLRALNARNVVYAGCPRHANTGDLLLMAGLRAAIREAGIEQVQSLAWPELPSPATEADTILLHGGGNFGDLYPHEMEFRMEVSQKYSSQRIIWLPQSIEYLCPRKAESEMRTLAAMDHVQFWLRDSVSLVRATEGGLTNVCLVPDGVFGLRTTPARYAADGQRLEVRRTDNESADRSCDSADWMLPGATMPHGAHEAWDLVAARFRRTRMVLTDRLHVHLLCVLSDIPNVLVADRYGKNRSMFLTWTHQHRRSRFARNWTEATVAEAALASSLEAESA